jgi:DNA-binding MarR family transcriptional regulator
MPLQQELGLDLPIEDLSHEAVLSVVRTATIFSQVAAGLFRRYQLTEAQFNVLFSLKYRDRDVTQADLGKRLVVTRASITSVLDKLESKGLVERQSVPGNRRIYHVALTEAGQRLVDRVEPVYRERVHAVMDELSESERQILIGMLERVRTIAVSSVAGAA